MIPLPPNEEKSARQRVYALLVLIFGLIALAMAWRWTTFSEYLDVTRSAAILRTSDFVQIPVVAVSVVLLASIAAVPLSVIIIIAAFTFGAMLGPVYVLIGAEIGAAISFFIGKHLGHDALRLFAGEKTRLLSQQLGENGIISIFLIRLVPAAPFAIVNMVAGASHIRMRDFLLGTLLGMMPGILMMTLFVDQIISAVLVPGWRSALLLLAILLLLVGSSLALNYWLKRSRNQ